MIYLVVLVKISVNDRSGVKIRVVSREGGGEGRESGEVTFYFCIMCLFLVLNETVL